jgi:hypothetical protein
MNHCRSVMTSIWKRGGGRSQADGLLHSPLYDIDVLAIGHDFERRKISDKYNGYRGEKQRASEIE